MNLFAWLRFDAAERVRPVAKRRRLACEIYETRCLLDGSQVAAEVTDVSVADMPVTDDPQIYAQAENGNFLFDGSAFNDPMLNGDQVPSLVGRIGLSGLNSNTIATKQDFSLPPLEPNSVDETFSLNLPTGNLNAPAGLNDTVSNANEATLYGPVAPATLSSVAGANTGGLNIGKSDAPRSNLIGPMPSGPTNRITVDGPPTATTISNNAIDRLFGSSSTIAGLHATNPLSEPAPRELERLPVTPIDDHTQPAIIDIGRTLNANRDTRNSQILAASSNSNLARLRNEAQVADERRLASSGNAARYEAEPRRGVLRAFESSPGPERVYSQRASEAKANPALEIARVEYRQQHLMPATSALRNSAFVSVGIGSHESVEINSPPVHSRFASREISYAQQNSRNWVSAESGHGDPLSSCDSTGAGSLWDEAWNWLTDQCFSISYHTRRSIAQTGVVVLASVTALAYYPRTVEPLQENEPRLRRQTKKPLDNSEL